MAVEIAAAGPPDLADVRALFEEYAGGLGFDLAFQGFADELRALPGVYAPPAGRLFLARVNGRPAGCAALRPFGEGIGEMKRLYVRPAFQGLGLGRALAMRVIEAAREAGYGRLRLDTTPGMAAAQALYASLGFRAIPAYRHNPVPGACFLELTLPAV